MLDVGCLVSWVSYRSLVFMWFYSYWPTHGSHMGWWWFHSVLWATSWYKMVLGFLLVLEDLHVLSSQLTFRDNKPRCGGACSISMTGTSRTQEGSMLIDALTKIHMPASRYFILNSSIWTTIGTPLTCWLPCLFLFWGQNMYGTSYFLTYASQGSTLTPSPFLPRRGSSIGQTSINFPSFNKGGHSFPLMRFLMRSSYLLRCPVF